MVRSGWPGWLLLSIPPRGTRGKSAVDACQTFLCVSARIWQNSPMWETDLTSRQSEVVQLTARVVVFGVH
eukprot:2694360-Prymnesium_polylepis.1